MAKPLGPTGEFFRRRDEWRKHPMLHKQWRHATPGLGIGLVAFGIYLVGEAAYNKIYAPNLILNLTPPPLPLTEPVKRWYHRMEQNTVSQFVPFL